MVIANEISQVAGLNRLLSEFWKLRRLPEDLEFDVALCIEEVVTNVIRHGYRDAGAYPIAVTIAVNDGWLEVEVEDEGVAFNPLDHPEPDLNAPIEKRPIGGLGIHIVRKLMDGLEYLRQGGVNRLRMKKKL